MLRKLCATLIHGCFCFIMFSFLHIFERSFRVIKGDSQLVIKQVNKEYACPQMAPYVEEVWKLQRRLRSFSIS